VEVAPVGIHEVVDRRQPRVSEVRVRHSYIFEHPRRRQGLTDRPIPKSAIGTEDAPDLPLGVRRLGGEGVY
jgi:hypothetical protein